MVGSAHLILRPPKGVEGGQNGGVPAPVEKPGGRLPVATIIGGP